MIVTIWAWYSCTRFWCWTTNSWTRPDTLLQLKVDHQQSRVGYATIQRVLHDGLLIYLAFNLIHSITSFITNTMTRHDMACLNWSYCTNHYYTLNWSTGPIKTHIFVIDQHYDIQNVLLKTAVFVQQQPIQLGLLIMFNITVCVFVVRFTATSSVWYNDDPNILVATWTIVLFLFHSKRVVHFECSGIHVGNQRLLWN